MFTSFWGNVVRVFGTIIQAVRPDELQAMIERMLNEKMGVTHFHEAETQNVPDMPEDISEMLDNIDAFQ